MYVYIYLCRLQMEHSRIIDDILKQQTPNRREITKKRSAEEALTNAAQRDIGSIFKVHFIIHTFHTYIHTSWINSGCRHDGWSWTFRSAFSNGKPQFRCFDYGACQRLEATTNVQVFSIYHLCMYVCMYIYRLESRVVPGFGVE
jgi:hypothetical protein